MIETKTLDELEAIGRGAIRAALPEADVSPMSDYDLTVRAVAAVAMGQQQQAEYVAKQIFPSTAGEEEVELHAARYGMTRLPAAPARGKVLIAASAAGITIPSGTTLTHADGTVFKTVADVTTTIDTYSTDLTASSDSSALRTIIHPNANDLSTDSVFEVNSEVRAVRAVITSVASVDLYEPLSSLPDGLSVTPRAGAIVSVIAATPGGSGNKAPGELLALALAPPSGETFDAPRVCELGGGGERETVEELRARIVAWEATIPAAGNAEDIRQLARTTPGVRVEDAVVFPGFRGLGTVDVFPIGVKGARVLSAAAVDLVAARLVSELPEALDVHVEPISYAPATAVDLVVTPGPGYEPDSGSGPLTVSGANVSTTVRVHVTSPPVGYEVGDRVQVHVLVGGRYQLCERRVAVARTDGEPYYFDLTEPLPAAPVVGDPDILPWGALVAPVAEAVESVFDRLGPAAHVDDMWVWERHPAPTDGWNDALLRAELIQAVMAVPGVANVVVAGPIQDIYPAAQTVATLHHVRVRFEGS